MIKYSKEPERSLERKNAFYATPSVLISSAPVWSHSFSRSHFLRAESGLSPEYQWVCLQTQIRTITIIIVYARLLSFVKK